MRRTVWILAVFLAIGSSCDSSDEGGGDLDAIGPEVPTDPGTEEGIADPGSELDLAKDPTPEQQKEVILPPSPRYGFTFRLPQMHDVPYTPAIGMPEETMPMPDYDLLCTFRYGESAGYLYSQGTPGSCEGMHGCIYATEGVWVSFDGVAQKVEDAEYDFGGNHNNDFVKVMIEGKWFKYFHSTFGFGYRKCQPCDCLQVLDVEGETVTEDGCTTDRALPIECVEIPMDGTLPDFPNTFSACPS